MVERRLFGADGIRGLANHVVTPESALGLGTAIGTLASEALSRRPRVVVGWDPRPSSDLLVAAVSAGIASAGADVLQIGVVPTATVAFLTPHLGAYFGIVVTASHNPLEDNGLKVFDREGWKLNDSEEIVIEQMLETRPLGVRPLGRSVGRIIECSGAVDRYVDDLTSGSVDLSGLRVALDCANGAAALLAPEIYRFMNVEVVEVASEPSGDFINMGVGSTNPEFVRHQRVSNDCALGIAHDGDADRVLLIDEIGRDRTGSDILAILATQMHRREALAPPLVVTTAMSNSGLRHSLRDLGIEVLDAPIGDRNVAAMMRTRGAVLGGEEYGHIILAQQATTGDGIRTAVQMLRLMAESGDDLSRLAECWSPLPQEIAHVPVDGRDFLDTATAVSSKIRELSNAVSSQGGRLMVRMSAIEPVVRVMCEGQDGASVAEVVSEVVELIRGELDRRKSAAINEVIAG